MADKLDQEALDYHRYPTPGKLRWLQPNRLPTSMISRWLFARVAVASKLIGKDPSEAFNLIPRKSCCCDFKRNSRARARKYWRTRIKAGYGGRPVLFKKFAGINVFDIEIDETKLRLIKIVRSWSRHLGGST